MPGFQASPQSLHNGDRYNAPPSTSAAQLVDKLGDRSRRSSTAESRQEDLRILLREIIQESSQKQIETDLNINYSLIYTIVRAGISITPDDPFASYDQLLSLSVDTLRVVSLTIRRCPKVVFFTPAQGDSTERSMKPGGPLFLWLVPYLADFLALRLPERIEEALRDVFISLLEAQPHAVLLGFHSTPIFSYMQGCIKDLLIVLNARTVGTTVPTNFTVPTIETVEEDMTRFPAKEENHIRAYVNHKEIDQACSTTLQLLQILLVNTTEKVGSRAESRNALETTASAVELLTKVHELLLSHNAASLPISLLTLHLHCLELSMKAASLIQDAYLMSCTSILLCKSLSTLLPVCQCSNKPHLQASLARGICVALETMGTSSEMSRVVGEILTPTLQYLRGNIALNFENAQDTQILIELALQVYHRDSANVTDISTYVNAISDTNTRAIIHEYIESRSQQAQNDEARPLKRLRLSDGQEAINDPQDASSVFAGRLYELLDIEEPLAWGQVMQIAQTRFSSKADTQQAEVFAVIGRLGCATAGCLETPDHQCPVCDLERYSTRPSEAEKDLYPFLAGLLRIQGIGPKGRVAAMTTLARLLSHTSNCENLDLNSKSSLLGGWCLQSLKSSLRELRIASCRALILYLKASKVSDPKILKANRLSTLNMLRAQSEGSENALHETCIIALGQVATHVHSEEETNLVLLRLLEYLGHPNSIVGSFAYDELLSLCHRSSANAFKLFEPYWRTVAPSIVLDLTSRPQLLQRFCELLRVSTQEMLKMTQYYTIPYLILRRKHDILKKIAEANGPDCSVGQLCLEPSQLSAILAVLLMQKSSDPEAMIVALLTETSAEFANSDLTTLTKTVPIQTTVELLKSIGDGDPTRFAIGTEALNLLSGASLRASGATRNSRGKQDSTLATFLQTNALAIMQFLADTISEAKSSQSLSERRRSVEAVRNMIKLAKGQLCSALPQICACLRTAIEDPQLSDGAFKAWDLMVRNAEEDDLEPLIVPTFAIIAHFWKNFDVDCQQSAYNLVTMLFQAYGALIRDIVGTIPSLVGIPLMSKHEADIAKLKAQMDQKRTFSLFTGRCESENSLVVLSALRELQVYLQEHQSYIHLSSISEQPDPIVGQLVRSLLDACMRFKDTDEEITVLTAKCLGIIGCLDPVKNDATREKPNIFVLNDFRKAEEATDFVLFFIQHVLVKAFLSAPSTRSQGFVSYVIQELLKLCGFDASMVGRTRDIYPSNEYRRWLEVPEDVRTILAPFLSSKYTLSTVARKAPVTYPIWRPGISHGQWLRNLVFDLLQNASGENALSVFEKCRRVVRGQDSSISAFLLPFIVMNIVLGDSENYKQNLTSEILTILSNPLANNEPAVKESLVLCSQNIFHVLDYFTRWIHEKKRDFSQRARQRSQNEQETEWSQVVAAERVLQLVPAETMANRAAECGSYARAIFYWEQHIRFYKAAKSKSEQDLEPLYRRLQEFYGQIDEPDGLEGVSAHMHILDVNQQILEHKRAGRWSAVQNWYELELKEKPDEVDIQQALLMSLKHSGQFDALLNHFTSMTASKASTAVARPLAVQAAWETESWGKLSQLIGDRDSTIGYEFHEGIGRSLLELRHGTIESFQDIINRLRCEAVRAMSSTSTMSLQSCHGTMLQLHAITELEWISKGDESNQSSILAFFPSFGQRLDIIGAIPGDKQDLLGLRRAAMRQRTAFSKADIAASWLTSARLARKTASITQAFNAVLHAAQLGDASATIEHSKLLWREGYHRKAIQILEGAISAKVFPSEPRDINATTLTNEHDPQQRQDLITAKAHLLLAKWIDRAGQTHSDAIIERYKIALEFYNRWEKGHYHLGKHYNKLLESEKAKEPAKQAQSFISGENTKLVIENWLRSLAYGAKYIHNTLPKVLTLWMDLGTSVDPQIDPKYGTDIQFRQHVSAQKRKMFGAVNSQMKKYIDRLPCWVWYTALTQIMARITHNQNDVFNHLITIISKVVAAYPQQALWPLFATLKSQARDRKERAEIVIGRLQLPAGKKQAKADPALTELRGLLNRGEKLTKALLNVCEGQVPPKETNVSLSRTLGFNHTLGKCRLVVPLESTLTAQLPPLTDNVNIKTHKPFSKDAVTIDTFLDDVLVLSSLQRPRKISIRGSDGKVYSLLCKPKDDLRKDQRLMEFNMMINRILKRDPENRKRRMYVRTYAVTPLNEDCGLIQWVDGLKALRDIILKIWKQRGIAINYTQIRADLDEACSGPDKLHVFEDRVLAKCPPVFHEWFIETFPEPDAWFTARLRYTRSAAVMSVVGHVLGLGDRHGENILLEEGNGGTQHVDFNCLFDKGLAFEKPERVPFRLTHNMIDAMGVYGYEGPFRKSLELTLAVLRQNEDTLMTILETFLYDPTTDFLAKRKHSGIVPSTVEGVLESVRNKVRGLLVGESVPLSVEGDVQRLIELATDSGRLASLYIGWAPFL